MSNQARGEFDVRVTPCPPDDPADTIPARLSLDKQFHGELEATSKGQMLAAGTNVPGSAGYVAIERVSGSLAGHNGTFVLQHIGKMTRGAPDLNINVVPDSGTGELEGLAGTMAIQIDGGKHSYEFDYTLPE